jgi:hypothetical protein
MKEKINMPDVEFIGGERSLTKKDEAAISSFIRSNQLKRSKSGSLKKVSGNPTRLSVKGDGKLKKVK